jgi:hypothetical protein
VAPTVSPEKPPRTPETTRDEVSRLPEEDLAVCMSPSGLGLTSIMEKSMLGVRKIYRLDRGCQCLQRVCEERGQQEVSQLFVRETYIGETVVLQLAWVIEDTSATVVTAAELLLTAREMKECMEFFFAMPSFRT